MATTHNYDLHLLLYNNYYNRQVKREETLADYDLHKIGIAVENINFMPNDGVSTSQIINCTDDYDYSKADYLVVADGDDIVSRWFVLEAKRERWGQYTLTLYRDTVVDFYDTVVNAPTFIEKATLSDSDPFIFNSENMTYNQIKTGETPLKDYTGTAWIVGYYAKNTQLEGTAQTNDLDKNSISIGTTLEQWAYYSENEITCDIIDSSIAYIHRAGMLEQTTNEGKQFVIDKEGILSYQIKINPGTPTGQYYNYDPYSFFYRSSIYNAKSRLNFTTMYNTAKTVVNQKSLNDILKYNEKIIKTSDNKYYRITVEQGVKNILSAVTSGTFFDEFRKFPDNINSSGYNIITTLSYQNALYLDADYNTVKLTYTQIFETESLSYDIPATEKIITEDAPYDIFCIPYNDCVIYQPGTGAEQYKSMSQKTAVAVASDIIKNNTGTNASVYDVQILPYCPIQNLNVNVTFTGVPNIDIRQLDSSYYSLITYNDETVGVIFNVPKSQFTTDIPVSLTNSESVKIQSECDMYRLCSPNFNGQFEFSAVKNGGIDFFNVDCTYKPFSPYIHVNPNFGRLYGRDYNDARGLICGGEFGMPIMSDQWQTYIRNNVNYNNSFERSITNLEVKQKMERVSDIANAIGNTVASASGGAISGIKGGPAGMVAGAVIGGVASGVGGAIDIGLKETLRNETIDYTRDQFGFAMGNIQALPNSLTRTTAMTYNNKVFPILEYYTCTDEEKQALKDKLYYNGMTVGRIGKIIDFLQEKRSYIKGKVIRLEDLGEDYHLAKTIADEINKGVFI